MFHWLGLIPAIRDRNTGIWRFLSATDAVIIKDPLVTTDRFLTLQADITIQTDSKYIRKGTKGHPQSKVWRCCISGTTFDSRQFHFLHPVFSH
jgi:hypothetical protein